MSKRDGLSAFGRFSCRFAAHILFLARDAEQTWQYSNPSDPPAKEWHHSTRGKLVYDFGANRGVNIPYYRRQGFRVVAVEANSRLAAALTLQYADDPDVQVVCACLVAEDTSAVSFWVHRTNDKLSTFVRPDRGHESFDCIEVPAITPARLFSEYGEPFYVKIDLEGADGAILGALKAAHCQPPYVSAEAHRAEVLLCLFELGYTEFKVVEGKHVHRRFFDLPPRDGLPAYSFQKGESAGPFGEDIRGEWMGIDELFQYIQKYGLGWRDIHAKAPGIDFSRSPASRRET